MKVLSAALTALVVVLGFAGAASAECPGYAKAAQTAQAPLLPPEGATGS